MREICEENEEYASIGQDLIRKEQSLRWISETGVTIGYMSSNNAKKSKGKCVYGQCERIKDKYRPFIPYDFLITVYEPNIIGFSKEQIRILIHHELLHVGINMNAEPAYKINPHDVEEFNEIIDRYGLDWSE